jgi:large subunit ribosomal protein L22
MPAFDPEKVVSRATARFQRVSARKARLIADLIRGLTVEEAMHALQFTHRPSAIPMVVNLLKSAVANVDKGDHPNPDELIVGDIQVDGGPIMYRFSPKARGRSGRIRKRFCHISMKLMEQA